MELGSKLSRNRPNYKNKSIKTIAASVLNQSLGQKWNLLTSAYSTFLIYGAWSFELCNSG
jgi:hypothetical protein